MQTKQRKKILLASRGRISKDTPAIGCKSGKTIFEQNMGTEIS